MDIKAVTDTNKTKAFSLLERYKESSLFLLGNYVNYGPVLTDHLNSGNFKYLLDGHRVRAVWCLTRRGNVLIQSDRKADYSPIIYEDCLKEPIPPSGVLGPFDVAGPLWDYLRHHNEKLLTKFYSKEALFKLDLNNDLSSPDLSSQFTARFLGEQDYTQWDQLDRAYIQEMGLLDQADTEQQKQMYLEQISQKYIWGLFENEHLVSTSSFNTRFKNIAQIGGVYTPPHLRRRGLSKLCVQQQIHDARHHHKLDQIILFTGQDNIAAQGVYQSLGFQRIGYFGLLIGEIT